MAEANFDHNDSSWLGVCVAGELYHPIHASKGEVEFNKEVADLARAIKKQLAEMKLRLRWPGATAATAAAVEADEEDEAATEESGANRGVALTRKNTLSRLGGGWEGKRPSMSGGSRSEVETLLFQHDLSRYADVCAEEGYREVGKLQQWANEEGEEWRMLLMRSKMSPEHEKRLRAALGVGPSRAVRLDAASNAGTAPHTRSSSAPASGSESISIAEYTLDVAPTAAEKKQNKRKDKRAKLIEIVNKKLRGEISNLCDTQVTAKQLTLPFSAEQDGEMQEIVIYNSDNHVLISLQIVSVTSVRRGLFTHAAMTVKGMLRCIKAHDDEGRASLRKIDTEDAESANFQIGQLVKKHLLPPLPKEEFIVVLSRKDYEANSSKFLQAEPSVHPYNNDERTDVATLENYRYHGSAARCTTKVVYRVHPDARERTFIPLSQYDQVVFEAKRAEFLKVSQFCCATSITVKDNEKQTNEVSGQAELSAEGGAIGGGGASADKKSEAHIMSQKFNLPPGAKPEFGPEQEAQCFFYEFEDSWKTMVDGRTNRGMESYDCTFEYTADQTKSASLKLGLQGIAGLDFSADKKEHFDISKTCTVRFDDGEGEEGEKHAEGKY